MKTILIASFFLAFMGMLMASAAMADDITGRFGVTGRAGFLVPLDTEFAFNVGGGGFMYGLMKNIALELDVTHTDFNCIAAGKNGGNFETNNISLGAQYRFTDSLPRLTPYVGAGLDILLNDFTDVDGTKIDVDTVIGFHLNGGVDYFIMKNLALTSQIKFVIAPDADMKFDGQKVDSFTPMGFSMTFGMRYFFK